MKLIPAKMEHVFAIYELVQETIKEIYSKYYAPGVVEFFVIIMLSKKLSMM